MGTAGAGYRFDQDGFIQLLDYRSTQEASPEAVPRSQSQADPGGSAKAPERPVGTAATAPLEPVGYVHLTSELRGYRCRLIEYRVRRSSCAFFQGEASALGLPAARLRWKRRTALCLT